MSDFDDGDDVAFFGAGDETPVEDLQLGLVVPLTARVILDPATGAIIWDELAEIEREFRRGGRPRVTFEEADPNEADPGSVT